MAEESIKKQIAAMESWAIDARKKAESSNYKKTEDNLKEINIQGRRLEWRGGMAGLRHLPDIEEVKELKKRISSARAAAKDALSYIHDLLKLLPRKEGKSRAEIAAIEVRTSNNKRDAGKNIMILIQVLKEARTIAEKEPWWNLDSIYINSKYLEMFLKGEGPYKDYSQEWRKTLWNKWISKKINFDENGRLVIGRRLKIDIKDLRGANLSGFNFCSVSFKDKCDLRRCDFSFANLEGVWLEKARLQGADFYQANLKLAFLRGANLEHSRLIGADLEQAYLGKTILGGVAVLDANFDRADFKDSKRLVITKSGMPKNLNKAKNIPPDTLANY